MNEELNEELEEIAMTIIANSGAARSAAFEALHKLSIAAATFSIYAFEALQKVKNKDFDDAEALLKSADDSLQVAHEAHRKLLQLDAKGEVTSVSILLCHAQDHLMGSALAKDLIREMVFLYQEK